MYALIDLHLFVSLTSGFIMFGKVMSITLQPHSISTLISPRWRLTGFLIVQFSGFSMIPSDVRFHKHKKEFNSQLALKMLFIWLPWWSPQQRTELLFFEVWRQKFITIMYFNRIVLNYLHLEWKLFTMKVLSNKNVLFSVSFNSMHFYHGTARRVAGTWESRWLTNTTTPFLTRKRFVWVLSQHFSVIAVN